MSILPDSTNNSKRSEATEEKATEELESLTQNHDEVLDLTLALGALGGLRHSAACDAAERSQKRFDERNHRLHESRMKSLGAEGEEQKPEAEDMSHQVLIRSPTSHHYYSERPSANQPAATAGQPVSSTVTTPKPGLSNLATTAIAAGLIASGLGAGAGATYLLTRPDNVPPAVERPDKNWDLDLLPPDPRVTK